MDVEQFQAASPGELVATSEITGATHAFVPDMLPPRWRWPESLWPQLLKASNELSLLEGAALHLARPELLLRPLQRREAQQSLTIEGTVTTPIQQALFDATPPAAWQADDPASELREVFNYRAALTRRYDELGQLPLSKRLICELHRILLEGVRGAGTRPGEVRTVQNQIDDPPRYVPPPPSYLPNLMNNLELSLHDSMPFDPLVRAFILHYQFEAIHPFRDGNGRVGRLLLALSIAEWRGLRRPWLYMSEFFLMNRNEYADRLLRVSTHGEWEGWVGFCLRGCAEQSATSSRRCVRVVTMHRQLHSRVAALGSGRLSSIVDLLFDQLVVRPADLARSLAVADNTARSDIRRLEDAGILEPLEGAYPAAYFCAELIQAVYGTV